MTTRPKSYQFHKMVIRAWFYLLKVRTIALKNFTKTSQTAKPIIKYIVLDKNNKYPITNPHKNSKKNQLSVH